MTKAPIIHVRHLTKLFGEKKAVDDISFEVHEGEVFGFLGPNGAGKTTTIRILLNLLRPSAGEVELFGLRYETNRMKILEQLNAATGPSTLPGKLTVEENLRVFSDLYGLKENKFIREGLLERFDLVAFRKRPIYSLSSGQQVRVSLAKAFLNKPRLLLLDEPTSSLDPAVQSHIRSLLLQTAKEEKTTVLITSHNMKEIEELCTRVVFLNQGKISAEGSPRELARRLQHVTVHLQTKTPLHSWPLDLAEHNVTLSHHGSEIRLDVDRLRVGDILTRLARAGVDIDTVSIKEPSLEDFFIQTAGANHPDE